MWYSTTTLNIQKMSSEKKLCATKFGKKFGSMSFFLQNGGQIIFHCFRYSFTTSISQTDFWIFKAGVLPRPQYVYIRAKSLSTFLFASVELFFIDYRRCVCNRFSSSLVPQLSTRKLNLHFNFFCWSNFLFVHYEVMMGIFGFSVISPIHKNSIKFYVFICFVEFCFGDSAGKNARIHWYISIFVSAWGSGMSEVCLEFKFGNTKIRIRFAYPICERF